MVFRTLFPPNLILSPATLTLYIITVNPRTKYSHTHTHPPPKPSRDSNNGSPCIGYHIQVPKRSGMGRIGRLIITEVRLLPLTLSFLAQVCVSPVTLSLPVRDAKPRLARLSHYTRPVPPPPSPTSQGHLWPRAFWGPGRGGEGCGVPDTCRRLPTVRSPAVRVLGFPGLPELGTRDRPL